MSGTGQTDPDATVLSSTLVGRSATNGHTPEALNLQPPPKPQIAEPSLAQT